MMRNARKFKQPVTFPLCALFFFIGAITAQAATYYVATRAAIRTPVPPLAHLFSRFNAVLIVVAAGDTCTVADGTYTDTDGNGIVGCRSAGPTGRREHPSPSKVRIHTGPSSLCRNRFPQCSLLCCSLLLHHRRIRHQRQQWHGGATAPWNSILPPAQPVEWHGIIISIASPGPSAINLIWKRGHLCGGRRVPRASKII